MNKRNSLIVITVLIVVIGYLYTLHEANTIKIMPPSETSINTEKILTPFNLESLDGSQITVGQPGKITVINFWATWCPPCREEMPELQIFAQKNQQKVNFYAINLQESTEKISVFMNKNQYTMPVLLDKDGGIGKKFQVTAVPTTIITNKQGVIKFRKAGAMTNNELEGIINSL